MTVASIRRIYQSTADRRQMSRLFDRHAQRPNRWAEDDSAVYPGKWFEIDEPSHDYMFGILPALFMRGDLFAMRGYGRLHRQRVACQSPLVRAHRSIFLQS